MAVSFIFGADGLPKTPQEAARLRAVAQAMAPSRAPQNVGEGLSSLGNAIAYRMMMNKAAKGDAMGQNTANNAFSALMSGFGGGSAPSMSPTPSASASTMPAFTPANQPPIPGIQPTQQAAQQPKRQGGNADYIRQGLVSRGLPEHVADAFVVNFQDESGLNPGINERNPIVPGSRGGYGLYQLTGPRRVAYERFAAERGAPLDDIDAQLDFLMLEGQGSEKAAFDKILAAPDKATAAQTIVRDFLRPSPQYRDSRMAKYASLVSPQAGSSVQAVNTMAQGGQMPMPDVSQEMANIPGYVDPMVSAPNSRAPVAQALARTQPMQPVEVAGGGGRRGIMEALMGGQTQTQDMPTDYFPAAPSAPGQAGPSAQQIMQVLTNPYASPEQKAIAQDMYTQLQQSRDPMRQLEMQKMQLELQRMQNPQQVRVLTAEEKKNLGLPATGAFQMKPDGTIDQIGGGGVNITNEGTIPAGYRAVRDAEGRVMAIEPLPGSPAAAEVASAADKKDKAQTVKETAGNVVMQDIDRTFAAMDDATLPTTGFFGNLLSGVGGTAARDIAGLTQTIKANASFDKLQQMREASPTGGALGAVSDTELGLLQAAVGNLEQSQSEPQFRDNLARVYNIYADIIHGEGKGPARKPLSFQDSAPKPADTPPPAGMDKEIWDVMTPEERALWK